MTLLLETKDSSAEWFGYYNYDTLNLDNTRMLCNRSKKELLKIQKGETIELGYYDISKGEWHKIGETDSWNWQQGAMMQWLPGKGNESRIIYNCSRNGHLTSSIHDIITKQNIDIDWPIYGITPDGKKSISLDLERSYWCRAYHYQSVANIEKDGRVVEGDGIFEIDLEKNIRRLLIDIKDVIALDPDNDFDEMKHWVEHIMINPKGTRFCFLHRYSPIGNVLQYRTRVCVANIDGSGLQVIPGWNTYMWSHFGWQGSDNFAIYTYKRPSFYKKMEAPLANKGQTMKKTSAIMHVRKFAIGIKKMIPIAWLKMILPKNDYYQHYVIDSDGQYKLESEWKQPYFNVDGHPSFTSDGKYMLTDSYPDQNNSRRFIVYNTENQKGVVIANMPENSLKGNAPCDLHPKLSHDNQYVVFDSTSSGKHTMLLFNINWKNIQEKIG